MTSISYSGKMYAGLEYETVSSVMGKVNKSAIKVVELVPDTTIALEVDTRLGDAQVETRLEQVVSRLNRG